MIADIDPEVGEETVTEYGSLGKIRFVHTDVADEVSVKQAIAATINTFGQLDALVNNAGISSPGRIAIEDLALEEWNRMIATNLTGNFLCAKYAAPHLRATRGAIVNIASTRAIQSEPNTFAYSASKGGVVALTHSLALSLGPEIRVNCISPGWIAVSALKNQANRREPELTNMDHQQHPAGRVGKANDIAAIVAFLIADQAGFITGQNFIVDGGMTKKMIYVE